MPRFLIMVAALLAGFAPALAEPADAPFVVGTAAAARGQKGTGVLSVPAGVDAALDIPVAVVARRAARPGAGARRRRARDRVRLDHRAGEADRADSTRPRSRGTVILVPLVNVPSFEQKVPHVNPVDGKSMNRFYPGKADGTQTERALYAITRQVVERCDYLIDYHGGDLDESLVPYSYWLKTGNEKQDAISRRDGPRVRAPDDHHRGGSAEGSGRLALSRQHRRDARQTLRHGRGRARRNGRAGGRRGARRRDVLASCGSCSMLSGSAGRRSSARSGSRRSGPSRAEQTGDLLSAGVPEALTCAEGMKLGYVTDYLGRTVFEARSPAAGVVLYVCAVPSMKKGETIANIGVVASGSPAEAK